jgi:hypothetical protein
MNTFRNAENEKQLCLAMFESEMKQLQVAHSFITG